MAVTGLGAARARIGTDRPRIAWPALILLGLFSLYCAGYELRVSAAPGLRGSIFDGVGPDIVMTLAGLFLIARSRREWAWAFIGLGSICWAAGDVYWTQHLSRLSSPPVPSWADAGYLSFCPLAFLGVVSLIRRRTSRAPATLLADAAAAALAVGALSAAIVAQPILVHAHGGAAAVATNLAYPLVDLSLLGLIVGAVALAGWRLERLWVLLGLGVLAFWIADSLYLIADAKGTYHVNDWYNPVWYFAPVLFAWAAWLPPDRPRHRAAAAPDGARGIVLPLLFGCLAIGTLAWGSPSTADVPAVVLATASLLVMMIRLALTWRENAALLHRTRADAETDALTGLRNRRALVRELDRRLSGDTDPRRFLLALFDLDGFKSYNDQFGHLAGDALLARLARKLKLQLGGRGVVYRMGGDEFCALIGEPHVSDASVAAAATALSEQGEGFQVSCSYGSVVLPDEARNTVQALRCADHRMYAQKRSSRASASRQSQDVLVRVLGERDPVLGAAAGSMVDMVQRLAVASGASEEEVDVIRQAAELHDIGKVAIPDAILDKAGQLTDIEWALLRSHTVVGERILDAAPGLHRVAQLVRSTHERYDGTGYPDGIAGGRIPLGARIIAVCDAYHAMTTARPYRQARDEQSALGELRRCAGTQFDPHIVEQFCREMAERTYA